MNDAATLANEMVGQIREEKQQHVLIRFFQLSLDAECHIHLLLLSALGLSRRI